MLHALNVSIPPDWQTVPDEFKADLATLDRLKEKALWQPATARKTAKAMERYNELLEQNQNRYRDRNGFGSYPFLSLHTSSVRSNSILFLCLVFSIKANVVGRKRAKPRLEMMENVRRHQHQPHVVQWFFREEHIAYVAQSKYLLFIAPVSILLEAEENAYNRIR